MDKGSRKLPFSELLLKLKQLCAEGATGLVVIRPSGTKLARMTLEKGEIVFVSFQEKNGVDALPLLATIDSGQLDFLEGLGGTSKSPLPPTNEIIANLATSVLPGKHKVLESDAISSEARGQLLGAQSRAILQSSLTEYIGPMATIICEGDLVRIQDLETAIKTLAKEIPDPENSRKFIEDVRAKLA